MVEYEWSQTIHPCLEKVGFGNLFLGVDCVKDEDCLLISNSICHPQTKKCTLPSLEDVENKYLECYIENMSYRQEVSKIFDLF